jgi:catechol 2,3-dioxygenase-like lactoylglutathione lyase family enzyme
MLASGPPLKEIQVNTAKNSIDLGIVVSDADKALAFYRDTLELEPAGEMPLPNGGRMYRLNCGGSVLKVSCPGKVPSAKAAPGGPFEGLGIRYLTIHVPDIRALMARLEAKGVTATMPITEIRPGVHVAMVTDPDGNTVEFLQPY